MADERTLQEVAATLDDLALTVDEVRDRTTPSASTDEQLDAARTAIERASDAVENAVLGSDAKPDPSQGSVKD